MNYLINVRACRKIGFNTALLLRKMASRGPIEQKIYDKLSSQLNTTYLEVINESPNHNVPRYSESHFKVIVVCDKFKGLPLIKRHRLVNDALKDELENYVHALSIIAKSTDQWEEKKTVPESPKCQGGFGK